MDRPVACRFLRASIPSKGIMPGEPDSDHQTVLAGFHLEGMRNSEKIANLDATPPEHAAGVALVILEFKCNAKKPSFLPCLFGQGKREGGPEGVP